MVSSTLAPVKGCIPWGIQQVGARNSGFQVIDVEKSTAPNVTFRGTVDLMGMTEMVNEIHTTCKPAVAWAPSSLREPEAFQLFIAGLEIGGWGADVVNGLAGVGKWKVQDVPWSKSMVFTVSGKRKGWSAHEVVDFTSATCGLPMRLVQVWKQHHGRQGSTCDPFTFVTGSLNTVNEYAHRSIRISSIDNASPKFSPKRELLGSDPVKPNVAESHLATSDIPRGSNLVRLDLIMHSFDWGTEAHDHWPPCGEQTMFP
ncbi:hypothetical protein F5141DRAFT_1066171 [Pisolithus sp. B1]|nr:hypothetical protein F5141DRAFT_1066171 [Pisolithus sp. B1]